MSDAAPARGRTHRPGPRPAGRGRGQAHDGAGPSGSSPARCCTPATARSSWPTSRLHSGRWLVRFEGVDDRNAAEALLGLRAHRRAAADRAPTSSGCTSSSVLPVRDRRGATLGARRSRSRRTRRATCSCSRASVLVPMRFVVEQGADGSWSSTRPRAARREPARPGDGTGRHAHRRLHDLPRVPRGAARRVAARPGPRGSGWSTCGCTIRASTRPTGTAASTTRRSAAAPGW